MAGLLSTEQRLGLCVGTLVTATAVHFIKNVRVHKRHREKHTAQTTAGTAEHLSEALQDEPAVETVQCPCCNSELRKGPGRGNLIRCLACRTGFCWECKQLLPENDPEPHFTKEGRCSHKAGHSDAPKIAAAIGGAALVFVAFKHRDAIPGALGVVGSVVDSVKHFATVIAGALQLKNAFQERPAELALPPMADPEPAEPAADVAVAATTEGSSPDERGSWPHGVWHLRNRPFQFHLQSNGQAGLVRKLEVSKIINMWDEKFHYGGKPSGQ